MSNEEIQKKILELQQAISQRAQQLAGADPNCARWAGQIDVYQEMLKESAEEKAGESPTA